MSPPRARPLLWPWRRRDGRALDAEAATTAVDVLCLAILSLPRYSSLNRTARMPDAAHSFEDCFVLPVRSWPVGLTTPSALSVFATFVRPLPSRHISKMQAVQRAAIQTLARIKAGGGKTNDVV